MGVGRIEADRFYGITLISVVGGGLKLKGELKFSLEMVVRKQE